MRGHYTLVCLTPRQQCLNDLCLSGRWWFSLASRLRGPEMTLTLGVRSDVSVIKRTHTAWGCRLVVTGEATGQLSVWYVIDWGCVRALTFCKQCLKAERPAVAAAAAAAVGGTWRCSQMKSVSGCQRLAHDGLLWHFKKLLLLLLLLYGALSLLPYQTGARAQTGNQSTCLSAACSCK